MQKTDPKSSSGQEQQQTAQTVLYPSPYSQQFEDDSIDLYELLMTLWKRKWLVITITLVAAIGSIVYALQLQHIYIAEALMLPPKAKDVQLLNVLGIQITQQAVQNSTGISANAVFSKFKQNLLSRTIQKKFIQEKGLMEILAPERTPQTRDEDIYQEFAELIKLGEKNGKTTLSIELHDAEIATQWVNDFTKFVDKVTVDIVVDELQNSISNEIRDIEYKIASKRQMAKRRREDQIIRYLEASTIAENLGIKRRVDATNIIQNTQMNVDIATATTPLYYLGLEALSTEISILINRESDDPFIGGLRDLQEQHALLSSIKYDQTRMTAVHIDQAAYPPKSPIKPNRRSIVSLTTVVGFFLGILLVFLIEYVQNQRNKHSE